MSTNISRKMQTPLKKFQKCKKLPCKSCDFHKNSLAKVVQVVYPFYRTTLEARREDDVKAKN